MTVKQRILAIKLLEKQKRNPDFAKKIGVSVELKSKNNCKKT